LHFFNKLFCFLVGVFISFLLLPTQIHAEKIIITDDNVNIRSGPGSEFKPIGKVHAKEEYNKVHEQGQWIEIELEDSKGWIHKEYISYNSGDKVKSGNKTITINQHHVHLRSGPSNEYEIISFAKKGESFPVIAETKEWYEVSNKGKSNFIFKEFVETNNEIKQNPYVFKNRNIVIDAGHGGHDVGAIGATGSFEKNITHLTADELKKELESLGANVYMTRDNDDFISLKSRAAYSNMMDTHVFISLHYNSFPKRPDVSGIETFYYGEQHKKLAQYLQDEMIKVTNAIDRGTSKGNYYVIRQNFKPAVLIELGFISNKEMDVLLHTNIYQKQLVNGIISGLGKYFSLENYH